MPERPFKNLSGPELTDLFARQLAKEPQVQRGDPLWGYVTQSGTNVETVFRIGADGRPEAVTRLVDKPSPGAARNVTDPELLWLRQRVDEICNWRTR